MKPTIIVEVRSVYGREAIYPICPKAKTFAQLGNTKTLSLAQIELIRDLGFEIRQVPTAGQRMLYCAKVA